MRAYLNNQTEIQPREGEKLFEKIASGKRSILAALGASPKDHFIFTTSGKEAVQKVFLAAYLDFVRETGRTHFLFHPSSMPFQLQQKVEKLGCVVKPLSVNPKGQITREILEENLRARSALVSLPWADPFTGVIHPILDLGELCHERGVLLHVEGSSAFGKFFFRFQDFPVDFLTFEGGLLHAPAGTGGIVVREERFSSAFRMDEESSSSSLISNLSGAFEKVVQQIDHVTTETARLRNKLEEGLLTFGDVSILFSGSERVPHICAARFEGVHNEALLFLLKQKGIEASVLITGHDALSFSLSFETTEEEIDFALNVIEVSLKKLRTFSVVP